MVELSQRDPTPFTNGLTDITSATNFETTVKAEQVLKIIDNRSVKDEGETHLEYLVKWMKNDQINYSWVIDGQLKHCANHIDRYRQFLSFDLQKFEIVSSSKHSKVERSRGQESTDDSISSGESPSTKHRRFDKQRRSKSETNKVPVISLLEDDDDDENFINTKKHKVSHSPEWHTSSESRKTTPSSLEVQIPARPRSSTGFIATGNSASRFNSTKYYKLSKKGSGKRIRSVSKSTTNSSGLDLSYEGPKSEYSIAHPFLDQLKGLHPTVFVNEKADFSLLPQDFTFIEKSVLREGVTSLDNATLQGCRCRPDNGRAIGCEYLSCECLEYSATDEQGKKQFPYFAVGSKKDCLRDFYLFSRAVIFECNDRCSCPPHCKNKVVQTGRNIPLEIFRTKNRGWGLRCPLPIQKGQFIDVYTGEVITSAEAEKREEQLGSGKDSYFYDLDKFKESYQLKDDDTYVVDGQYMGGPTRFMNHSCDPNCRQFAVTYNKYEGRLYDLAFFAIHDIPANEELTFNYVDSDDGPEGVNPLDERSGERPTRCLCGAINCKGWLWL